MSQNNSLSPSIIIPVYNRASLIGAVIEALLEQTYKPLEIIVVDDGSTDETARVVSSYPVRYIYQKNSGPASARNRGFRESRGDIIAFIDSDCIAKKDWLENLLKGFDSPEVGAVAGSYDIANPESILSRLIHEEIRWRHSRFKGFIRAFGSYNVAIRRTVFEQVGGFDETYRTASGEDNDLSYRILKAGYRIRFMPDALVAHYHTERLFKYLKEQFRHAFWRMKLYRDHPDMTKGDDYTLLKDGIEIPLGAMILAGTPLLFTEYWYAELSLIILFILFSIPMTVEITLKRKDLTYLLLIPLFFLRALSRLGGFLKGIWHFWFKRVYR